MYDDLIHAPTTFHHFSSFLLALSMQVEMLIRSHDCYTLACSVDGIAEVLRVARDITAALYKGRHYKLMVSLLSE